MSERLTHRQRRRLKVYAAIVLAVGGVSACFQATGAGQGSCGPRDIGAIPSRNTNSATGSEFARRTQGLSGSARDAQVRSELLSGNLPDFLRHLVPVTLKGSDPLRPVQIVVCVMPDYLAIGSDHDFLFVPMGLKAALLIADRLGFMLPTPKLVDTIYAQSAVKLEPRPLPPGDEMRSTSYIVYHNELINEQRDALAARLGELTAGDKKDLVLTSRLWDIPGRVAIYGWHRAVHQPIQPLSTVHGARYADYSHGVRLVSGMIYVDGARRRISEVLGDPDLARLLTAEAPLPRLSERLNALAAALTE